MIYLYIICVNKNKKGGKYPRYSIRIPRGNLIMTKFFNDLEKGYPAALGKNILWFTVGWIIGTAVKTIVESFIDSKAK